MRLREGEYNSKTGEHELHLNRGSNWYKGKPSEREARQASYNIHLERMKSNEEYRMNWERNESDMIQAMKERDYHHE